MFCSHYSRKTMSVQYHNYAQEGATIQQGDNNTMNNVSGGTVYNGPVIQQNLVDKIKSKKIIIKENGTLEVSELEEESITEILNLRKLEEMHFAGYMIFYLSEHSINNINPCWIGILESMGCSYERRWQAREDTISSQILIGNKQAAIIPIRQIAMYALSTGCVRFPELKYAFEGCSLSTPQGRIMFYKRDNQLIGSCHVEFTNTRTIFNVINWHRIDLFIRSGTTDPISSSIINNKFIDEINLQRLYKIKNGELDERFDAELQKKNSFYVTEQVLKTERVISKIMKGEIDYEVISKIERRSLITRRSYHKLTIKLRKLGDCFCCASLSDIIGDLGFVVIDDDVIFWLSTGYVVAVAGNLY